MKINSLRFKALLWYSLSLIIMLAFYGWAQFGTMRITEDEVINNILNYEAEDFFKRYKLDRKARLPTLKNMQAFTDSAALPPEFQNNLKHLSDGAYETSGPMSIPGPPSHNILIKKFPDNANRLFLIYYAAPVLTAQNCTLGLKSILFLLFVCTATIGLFLTFIIGKIIFQPLDSLSGQIRRLKPEDMDITFIESRRNDEIGLLASSIQTSFMRVKQFLKREQEFTRDASHELRTPVSVIKSAVELIKLSPVAQKSELHKPLARIERSAQTMEETIETLLWLAREENKEINTTPFEINKVVKDVINNLTPLIERKKITLKQELYNCFPNNAPEQTFRIAFSNILINALNFSPGATVGIKTQGTQVIVWDKGIGIPKDLIHKISTPHIKGQNSSGFGLGLSIVKRLCDHFKWEFDISPIHKGGTRVIIDLSSTSRQ